MLNAEVKILNMPGRSERSVPAASRTIRGRKRVAELDAKVKKTAHRLTGSLPKEDQGGLGHWRQKLGVLVGQCGICAPKDFWAGCLPWWRSRSCWRR